MTLLKYLALPLVCLTLAGPAFAHAHLDSATPADGATLAAAPKALTLAFTEALEPKLVKVVLKDAAGKPVAIGAPEAAGKAISVPLPALAAGAYSVEWTVTSVDTHASSGTFGFVIK